MVIIIIDDGLTFSENFIWIFVLHQVCSAMACAEDYLIDDDISTKQFNGTLTFTAETASSQTAVDDMEPTGNEKHLVNFLLFVCLPHLTVDY